MAKPGDNVDADRGAGAAERFDAVVIGSGFGGSIAAWRLKKQCPTARVLLLERGMPYPPRSFARTPREMRGNFWDPYSSLFGLYEMWRFKRSSVLVSSGLGGGSLIYANVMLEKEAGTFTEPDRQRDGWDWPIDYADIAKSYEWIKKILGENKLPAAYRSGDAGSAAVAKTDQFIQAAEDAQLENAQLADLAITFAAPGREAERGASLGSENLHARERRTCTLVGECDMGCNEGAKNSLDYNFLTEFVDEERLNGTIRTCCEATEISLDRGQDEYEIRYLQHLQARARVEERAEAEGKLANDRKLLHPERVERARVRAKVVVLAAGTLGSTRLLLASRPTLPSLSPELGRRFSSNGDMLLFARNCTKPDGAQRELTPSHGPVITAYATKGEGLEKLWVEDAGGPNISEWGWQLPEMPGDIAKMVWKKRCDLAKLLLRRQPLPALISKDAHEVFGDARASAAMLPMLAMGRDVPSGRISLDRGMLSLDWDPADSRAHFDRAEASASSVAKNLGGALWPRRRWLRERFRGVTVHPLGGCPMGRFKGEGVVRPTGEVFECDGLFVADGSVMPGPIGPNPSLTIAAIADRIATAAADRLAERLA